MKIIKNSRKIKEINAIIVSQKIKANVANIAKTIQTIKTIKIVS